MLHTLSTLVRWAACRHHGTWLGYQSGLPPQHLPLATPDHPQRIFVSEVKSGSSAPLSYFLMGSIFLEPLPTYNQGMLLCIPVHHYPGHVIANLNEKTLLSLKHQNLMGFSFEQS